MKTQTKDVSKLLLTLATISCGSQDFSSATLKTNSASPGSAPQPVITPANQDAQSSYLVSMLVATNSTVEYINSTPVFTASGDDLRKIVPAAAADGFTLELANHSTDQLKALFQLLPSKNKWSVDQIISALNIVSPDSCLNCDGGVQHPPKPPPVPRCLSALPMDLEQLLRELDV